MIWLFADIPLGPGFGNIPLARLRPQHVQKYLNEKSETHLSPRSVQYHHAILRSALNQAVKWGTIARNPASLVDSPRVPRPKIRPLTVDEARQFLAAMKGHRLEGFYTVGMSLGLRLGEILGLPSTALDLGASTLSVTVSLQRIDGKIVFAEPKNDRARRTIALPEITRKVLVSHLGKLEQYRLVAGARWREHGLVFPSSVGTPLHPRNVLRHFHKTLRLLGIDRHRLHDLRHTAATFLLAQGVHPRVVMDILGHSQMSTTMDIYSHVMPTMVQDAMAQMDALLNPVATSMATLGNSEAVQ